jgi:hypothetical protein
VWTPAEFIRRDVVSNEAVEEGLNPIICVRNFQVNVFSSNF